MARTYLVFGDIEGKLDMLRVECTRCGWKGRYHVHKLIEKYGRKANMMKWRNQLNGDCPKRDALRLTPASRAWSCRDKKQHTQIGNASHISKDISSTKFPFLEPVKKNETPVKYTLLFHFCAYYHFTNTR
jgi:hypothetical protein